MKEGNALHPVWLLSILMLGICCFFSPASGYCATQKIIAYIGVASDKPFWATLGKAMRRKADQKGVVLIDLTPAVPDAHLQKKLLERVVNNDIAVLILGADSPVLLTDALTRLQKAGIPVVAVDTMIDHPAISTFVGTDNLQGAILAGRYIVRKTKGKGTLLILGGTPNHPAGDARRKGVSSEVKAAGMAVIFRHAHWNDGKAYSLTVEELRKNNTITAIFSCWDPGIDTAAFAAQKMKIDRELVLVGFDGLPRTISYIRQGMVTATVAQDTELMGQQSLEMAVRLANGKSVPTETLIAPYIIDRYTLTQHD